MKRTILALAAVAALGAAAYSQTFPFQETFAGYPPGSTGAPAWSALSGRWSVRDSALEGPLTARFNGRPPKRIALDVTLVPPAADAWDAAIVFDMQQPMSVDAADAIRLTSSKSGAVLTMLPGAVDHPVALEAGKPAHLRLILDGETGRAAAFVGDAEIVTSAATEFASGLLAVRLGEGVSATAVSLRAPTAGELRSTAMTTLFNDPRALIDGGDGALLVLHRSSPCVLMVSPQGDVIRSFGRRLAGGIPDPVAMRRGFQNEILVLNRYPGEVVAYEQNGGIRYRFGAGRLVEPSDLIVLPDGTVYVADPGAKRIFAYDGRGRYLGAISTLGTGAPLPVRLALDAMGSLLAVCREPDRVVSLRPEADRSRLTFLAETPGAVDDAAAVKGQTWALRNGAVTTWPATPGAPAFHAEAVGGLGAGGRLTVVGEATYVLDRTHSRIVAIPASLADSTPEVTFQNIAQSSALVRWTSAAPSVTSSVRVLRGSTWDTVSERNSTPVSQHQVVIERLLPGRTYRYTVSPTVATIPASDSAAEHSFSTSPEKQETKK
ncbi:MAG TPA: hypothetical protein VGM37_13830 [Armatimonadota bacterium]|jgi:hypothetical protein